MEIKQRCFSVYFTPFELCMVFANQLCKVFLCKCVCVNLHVRLCVSGVGALAALCVCYGPG